MEYTKEVARFLLETKAVKLEPTRPFTWASGWKSPIYCDNRKTLSFPNVRSFIRNAFVDAIIHNFTEVDVVAGVATGAIAQGALVADQMEKPFIYVRSAPKSHGMENLIEGDLTEGQKVIVVEDLISTGGSSLKAVEAVRNAGCQVVGMVAIFSYGFPLAEQNFADMGCKLVTLTSYQSLLETAIETGYIKADQLELLKKWREAPDKWGR